MEALEATRPLAAPEWKLPVRGYKLRVFRNVHPSGADAVHREDRVQQRRMRASMPEALHGTECRDA